MTPLEKHIEHLSIGGRVDFADCFNNFLDLSLSFFCNNPNDRQRELFAYMLSHNDFNTAFTEAMQAFGDAAEGYKDPLGDMFMNRISHGQKGQFFTPDSLSLLMSQIAGIRNGASINDPACGSGRTLLKALQIARDKGEDVELHANDLSMTCAKMTLLNFVIHSAIGEVSCGDALKLDYENFTFFKIDRLWHLERGMLLSTYWEYTLANRQEVEEQRNKWWVDVAGLGWVKNYCKKDDKKETSQTQQIDTLPTEVKTDENGQLTLW